MEFLRNLLIEKYPFLAIPVVPDRIFDVFKSIDDDMVVFQHF